MEFGIVVVLYKKRITELSIYPFLTRILGEGIPVICYDNSPSAQAVTIQDSRFEYIHDSKNLGLSRAYNYALAQFKQRRLDGILLLDHDTELSFDYLQQLKRKSFGKDIGAIVPRAFVGEKQISPLNAKNYIDGASRALSSGLFREHIMAINSGSLINITALNKLGGFNDEFPLDFLDHWLFYELNRMGYSVEVTHEIIQHDLSVLNYAKLSHKRFDSILNSESLYYMEYQTNLLKRHRQQLLRRMFKLLLTVRDQYFWLRCWREYRWTKL